MQNDKPIDIPIKSPTPGEWIVTTVDGQIVVVQLNEKGVIQRTLATFGDEDAPNANEHIANAALFAVSKNMLDALVVTQSELMTSKQNIDLEALNHIISECFAKLANEAGEEL